MPAYGAMILFTAQIFPLLGSGPQWKLMEAISSDPCKNYWSRNLLFIQNYYKFGDKCLPQSHYITTDTCLFVLATLLMYLLWKVTKKSIPILIGLILSNYLIKAYVIFSMRISEFIYSGAR
jgi:hypothetical protein